MHAPDLKREALEHGPHIRGGLGRPELVDLVDAQLQAVVTEHDLMQQAAGRRGEMWGNKQATAGGY